MFFLFFFIRLLNNELKPAHSKDYVVAVYLPAHISGDLGILLICIVLLSVYFWTGLKYNFLLKLVYI